MGYGSNATRGPVFAQHHAWGEIKRFRLEPDAITYLQLVGCCLTARKFQHVLGLDRASVVGGSRTGLSSRREECLPRFRRSLLQGPSI